MPVDGDIDFSGYSDYDLQGAADYIDADHFPENYRRLNLEIDRRGIRGKDIPSPQVAKDARDAAESRDGASKFDMIANAILAAALFIFGARGLLYDDLITLDFRGSGSPAVHAHGFAAVLGGGSMLLGAVLLVISLVVYRFDGHKYTPLYRSLARYGRYLGVPLLLGSLLARYV